MINIIFNLFFVFVFGMLIFKLVKYLNRSDKK